MLAFAIFLFGCNYGIIAIFWDDVVGCLYHFFVILGILDVDSRRNARLYYYGYGICSFGGFRFIFILDIH